MKEQFRRGGWRYLSFILLDLICLTAANAAAAALYPVFGEWSYGMADHAAAAAYMLVIDVFVTVAFNTLDRVLRRGKRKEAAECFKHTVFSFVILALVLFSVKQGAAYSRMTIYTAYAFYFILLVFCHIGWKEILKRGRKRQSAPSALLVTTAGYRKEGAAAAAKAGTAVKGIFLTDRTNEVPDGEIPVIVDKKDAVAFVCWEWIDKIFICGPESMDVPDSLLSACRQMGIPVRRAPAGKNLDYEIIRIRTALLKDDPTTGLSFFEGEHDIPFQIRRFYTVFESEQERQKGFHAHKQSWHLFFCPYGAVDVLVDTGKERKKVPLSDPSTGLILHPGVWREMTWKKEGSVLCVAASGHYDPEKLRNDYSEYLEFLQEKERATTMESAEIMGEVVG